MKKNKHIFNKNFFSKPTIKNSYWAGFIAADGCIVDKSHTKNCSKVLDIRLNKKDLRLLECFKNDINSNARVYEYGNVIEFKIVSDKICNDLTKNFNITPRKSLTLKPPKGLTKKQSLAYIRGYIDGDGSIKIPKETYKNGNKFLIVQIVGTKKVLSYINKTVAKELNINPKNIYKTKNIYRLLFSPKESIRIIEKLNTLNTFYLARKWDKLKYIKEHNVSKN